MVSGSEDGALYAWDVLEGKVIEKMEGVHGGKVASAVAWNGNGKGKGRKEWASAGTDCELYLFDCGIVMGKGLLMFGIGTVVVWGPPA